MPPEVKLVQAEAIVAKQPSPGGPEYDEYHTKKQLCRLLNLTEEDLMLLKRLCDMGRGDKYAWLHECKTTISHCRTVCDSVKSECLSFVSTPA